MSKDISHDTDSEETPAEIAPIIDFLKFRGFNIRGGSVEVDDMGVVSYTDVQVDSTPETLTSDADKIFRSLTSVGIQFSKDLRVDEEGQLIGPAVVACYAANSREAYVTIENVNSANMPASSGVAH